MIVVSDASPLIAFDQLGLLHLLPELFGEIIVPDEVAQELLAGSERGHRARLLNEPWIIRRSIMNTALLADLLEHLDSGESEAIALAVDCDARLLLIDDSLGRREATRLGLTVIGTAGILQLARAAGLIEVVAPLLYRLRDEFRFRLSDATIEVVLKAVGEA